MNSRQRRTKKRAVTRQFPPAASMRLGSSLRVKRVYGDFDPAEVNAACPDISKILHDEPNERVLVGNCDSLTDSLRNMKAGEAQHLRYAFDPETNMVEVTNTLTGTKSTHVITNLTEAAKDAIMNPQPRSYSMGFKL